MLRRFTAPALALVFVYGLAQILWGERIPLTEGLGAYDGRRYGEIAKDFPREVFDAGVDAFRLQRVLPSGVVHVALEVAGSSFTSAEVVRAFLLLNWALQLGLVLVWSGIARASGLGLRGAWLGFVVLFVSFAGLRQPYFYPVLTDTPATMLGALLLYFHLTDRPRALLGVMLAGAFTWPSLFVSGTALFAFARRPLGTEPPPAGRHAAGVLLAVAGLLIGRVALAGVPETAGAWTSTAIVAAFAAGVAWALLGRGDLFALETYRRALSPGRLFLAASLFVALQLVVSHVSAAPGMTLSRHLRHLYLYNDRHPGLFLVAHATYFGPAAVLLLWLGRKATRAVHELGLGLTLFAAIQLAQSFNTESRQIVDALPLYALMAARAGEACLRTRHVLLLAFLGVVASKVWLSLSPALWGELLQLPAYLYFMNVGPNVAAPTLVVLAGFALLTWAAAELAAAGRAPAAWLLAGALAIAFFAGDLRTGGLEVLGPQRLAPMAVLALATYTFLRRPTIAGVLGRAAAGAAVLAIALRPAGATAAPATAPLDYARRAAGRLCASVEAPDVALLLAPAVLVLLGALIPARGRFTLARDRWRTALPLVAATGLATLPFPRTCASLESLAVLHYVGLAFVLDGVLAEKTA